MKNLILQQQLEVSNWDGQIYLDRNAEARPVCKIYLKRVDLTGNVRESEIFISDEDAAELRTKEVKDKYALNIFDYSQIK